MTGTPFEGSYLGDAARIAEGARLECGVCWHVYDPSEGDAVWQIEPGTSFAALPDHWRCPVCDAPKERFMVLASAPAGEDVAQIDALQRELQRISAGPMQDVPICNPRLSVELVGFHRFGDGLLGIAITPWFINALLLPDDKRRLETGKTRAVALPSGVYDFLSGMYDDVGPIWSLSLFSPCQEFSDQDAARLAAQAAIAELMAPPSAPEPRKLGRRALFSGSAS